jgi:hypothetical protein
MGKDTLCRVEETRHPKNKPVIKDINDIFDPNEKQGIEERRQLSEIHNCLVNSSKNKRIIESNNNNIIFFDIL